MKKGITMSIFLSVAALGMAATDSHAQEVGTITASALNIRSGAGTENPVVAKAYKGQTVTILESKDGWYKIELSNGTTGWGSGDYIRTGSQALATSTPESGTGTITASSLNIRSGAGTGYQVVTTAYKGQNVTILESQGGWYKVSLSNGTIGWASGSYVSKGSQALATSTPAPSTSTSTPASGTGTITASSLNIRSGAGTGYQVITTAYKGQTVTLLESQSGWYKVRLSNGTIGWASGSYVSKGSQESVSEAPSRGTDRSAVVNLAYAQMGKPYRWGAEGPSSFDCSGFTSYVYKNAEGKSIPRTSVTQSSYGTSVSRSELQSGDLVFFDTDRDGDINHVGIYVGGGKFIHASSGAGKVTVSDLNAWYSDKFVKAKRP
jgi:uncharacterized protein YgiM (DUF1202 family)